MISLRLLQGRWRSALARNVVRGKALTTAADSSPEAQSEEVRLKPSEEELSGAEPWMVNELERYYQGRTRLADMMGIPPHKFTDEDVEDALRYLLPSRLFARDARPSMKHPFKIFPDRKEALFDKSGRPLDAGFYTGSPAYQTLVYQIFEQGAKLTSSLKEDRKNVQNGSHDKVPEEAKLSNILDKLSDKKQNEFVSPLDAKKELLAAQKETEPLVSGLSSATDEEELLSTLEIKEGIEQQTLVEETVKDDIKKELSDSKDSSLEADTELPTSQEEQDLVSSSNMTEESQKQKGELPSSVEAGETVERTVPKVWIKKESMENIIQEELSDIQYSDLVKRLSALASHPKSSAISSFLDQYRQPIFSYRSVSRTPTPSEDGSVRAMGKRKTATAMVTLRPGTGFIRINKKPFLNYFPRAEDRHQVLYPLQVTELLGKYDVTVSVEGGGLSGQSGAIRLGISKALLGFPGNHSDVLESKGLLVRDHRMVERKKPGQKKARKKFAWVKR